MIAAFLILRALRRSKRQNLEQGNGIEERHGIGGVESEPAMKERGHVVKAREGPYPDNSAELSEYLGPASANLNEHLGHKEGLIR